MADFTTAARPYAKAVFEIARESGQFDDWSARLAFWASVVQSPEMVQRLESPAITQSAKAELLETVAQDGMDEPSRNFIRLLAENNRLEILGDVHGLFEELRAEEEGEIEAQVTSAFELNEEQLGRIAEALSRRLDRRVRLVSDVDQELVGGAIIRAGDLVIDGSLRGRIDKMARSVAN